MFHGLGESSSHVQAGQAALDRSPLPNLEAPGDQSGPGDSGPPSRAQGARSETSKLDYFLTRAYRAYSAMKICLLRRL